MSAKIIPFRSTRFPVFTFPTVTPKEEKIYVNLYKDDTNVWWESFETVYSANVAALKAMRTTKVMGVAIAVRKQDG